MNDWWEYLAHGLAGSEKDGHRYYMRIRTGSRNGKNVYRYFYTKDEYAAYVHSGQKRLTGEYGSEKHPNGRTAHYAMEQYMDENGKFQTRKKYVTREEADKLRNNAYRKEKALNETPKEKEKRMKEAKKRYKKKTSAARRKRAVQKGLQTVSRLMGRQLDYHKKEPEDWNAKQRYKKSKWHKSLIPDAYSRKLPK